MTNDEIIKEEIDGILKDIISVYESTGKKVSGQFAEGLEAIYEPNKGTIKGYVYLAGRGKTKESHKEGEPYLVDSILAWIKSKGIKGRSKKTGRFIKHTSLAWAIATKIHREGTNRENWMKIYEQVITPQRINSIIKRVEKEELNRIITGVTAQLEILAKEV